MKTHRYRQATFYVLSVLLTGSLSKSALATPHIGLPHGNIHRTGYSLQVLRPPYRLAWCHETKHKPRPAWREPGWEPQRIDFDYAYAVSAHDQTVYYASSSDHGLHALNLNTGQEKWVFFTEGPVRLAPDFYEEWVLFTSDDGNLYCVDRDRGQLVWKYRPEGIPDERRIGNEQMISRWPGRSGVLVEDHRLYTTFGMLSSEGIAVCCLDIRSGKPIWMNDTSGYRFMARPHTTAMGGVAPQGYLAVNNSQLIVSCGRSTPAFFDKHTGKCLYHEADGDFTGGALVMATDRFIFTQADTLKKEFGSQLRREDASPEAEIFELATLVALDPHSGREAFSLRGGSRAVLSDSGGITIIGRQQLIHVTLDDILTAVKEKPGYISHTLGHFVKNEPIRRWAAPVDRVYSLLQADQTIVAGGNNWLACFDADSGTRLWQTEVKGQVRTMCLTQEGIIASTTEGHLYCFTPQLENRVSDPETKATIRQHTTTPSAQASDSQGYCLALGDHNIKTLTALAHGFEWVLFRAPQDQASKLRESLYNTGLYGNKIIVHGIENKTLPYTDYFADEIHVQLDSRQTLADIPLSEVYRLLRPYGGRATIRFALDLSETFEQQLTIAPIPPHEINHSPGQVTITRGALPGAGQWTHQYGDPGKRTSSDERRVRLPLKATWFGSLGPSTILSRHFREPAPLVLDGRCLVPGTDHLTCMNIYNGRILWQRHFPNLAHWPAAYRGPSLALDHRVVYALQERDCLLLDPETGVTLDRYPAPSELLEKDQKGIIWEYLAVTDKLIIGTLGIPNQRKAWWSRAYPVNHILFALDKQTGDLCWFYRAREGIDSNAIVIDDGRICLIDGQPRYGFLRVHEKTRSSDKRTLLALNLTDGSLLWEHEDIEPTLNSLWLDQAVLVATQIPFSRATQDKDAAKAGGGITAYSAQDGSQLWRVPNVETLMPIIIGNVFYSPEAYDLKTGRPLPPLAGGSQQFSLDMPTLCSTLSGCPSLVMARRSSLGFIDLTQQAGTYQVPVIRSSCWINMIPAGGLIVVPEGGSSCQCAYNYKTSMALMSDDRHYYYGIGGSGTAGKPALRLNLGAPGDRADEKGQMWRAWPRPVAWGRCLGTQPYGPKPAGPNLPIQTNIAEELLESYGKNPDWISIQGTKQPWLYACGLRGPLDISINPKGIIPKTKRYRVTLYFCELTPTTKQRVFDIKLMGKTMLNNYNTGSLTSPPRQALQQSFTVSSSGTIDLQLIPPEPTGPAPILSGLLIEATEE